MTFTCCQCVFVALVSQHVMRMCRIILPSVAPLAQSHFPTLSHKWHEFREGGKITEPKMCDLTFSTNFV